MSIISDLGFTEEEATAALAGLPTSPIIDELDLVEEKTFNAQEVQDLAKESLDFLAALVFPLVYKFPFPPVFLSVWEWLVAYVSKVRDFSQLALGLPRGFGKTFVVKLFILFVIVFTKRKFILIFSETEAKAKNIIADICDALDEPNVKKVFGDWRLGLEIDRQELKKFAFRGRTIILLGAGAGTSIRGITIKNERPDIMLFDDIQSRECADSQVQSENLERWLVGTAMKAKSPHGCLFIFVANMYPTKWSILRRLKTNPTWIKFIAGGILADGTSLWEELQPISQLMKELENDMAMGRPEIFFSEVLNDETASSNYLIDLQNLPKPPFSLDDIAAGNCIIIDPSNDKANSDAVSIGYFEIKEGYPVLEEVTEGKLSPGDTIREALKLAFKHNCRLIAVESNAYQYSLLYWFNFICNLQGISGIECVDLYSGIKSKNSRIITMLKAYAAGELFVHPRAQAAVHSQILMFNPLKTDNTDGILDLLTYVTRAMELYGEFMVSANIINSQEFSAMQDHTVLENSAF